MRLSPIAALLAATLALTVGASAPYAAPKEKAAASAREVTVKGTIVCAKCQLKEAADCQNVLKATEEGKEVKYYLAKNAVSKLVGGKSVAASVTGTVSQAAGKKTLTASHISYE